MCDAHGIPASHTSLSSGPSPGSVSLEAGWEEKLLGGKKDNFKGQTKERPGAPLPDAVVTRREGGYLRASSWLPVSQVFRGSSPVNEKGFRCSVRDTNGVAVRSLQCTGSSRTGWQASHPSRLTMPHSTPGSCLLGGQLRHKGEGRASMWPELFCSM